MRIAGRRAVDVPVLCAALVAAALLMLAADTAHASTFTVEKTDDGGAGSLRQAIVDANSTPGTDTIGFDIPGTDGGCDATSGVCTITPSSALPNVTDPVIIDGYSQPGASTNTLAVGNDAVPKIELSGAVAPADTNGLRIEADNSTVGGLIVSDWENGVFLGADATGNTVRGNFIGTDASDAESLGNNIGVVVLGAENTVGGAEAAARNTISGNSGFGVQIAGVRNKVQGNYIGTDAAGTEALRNNLGVVIDAGSDNIIGGTKAAARNTISANSVFGIRIAFAGATGNRVQGNFIGTDATGAEPLGNGLHGVSLQDGAANNTIGGTMTKRSNPRNVISANGGSGVEIFDDGAATGNRILSNSIYDNDDLGIDLVHPNDPAGVTLNDEGDGDVGANRMQNFPDLDSARTGRRATTVKGTLNSTAEQRYIIQFFSSPAPDPSGNGEGQKFLGQTSVSTGPSGEANFTFKTRKKVPRGQVVTATATNTATGDTSEFSAVQMVG